MLNSIHTHSFQLLNVLSGDSQPTKLKPRYTRKHLWLRASDANTKILQQRLIWGKEGFKNIQEANTSCFYTS